MVVATTKVPREVATETAMDMTGANAIAVDGLWKQMAVEADKPSLGTCFRMLFNLRLSPAQSSGLPWPQHHRVAQILVRCSFGVSEMMNSPGLRFRLGISPPWQDSGVL